MAAEHYSASLVSQLSLPGTQQMPQGYFRSKLFVAPFTTNPLVAAAGPVLSLLERLGVSPSLPPVQTIRGNIEHELLAFHSRVLGKSYSDEFIAIARYLLCATIDELLGKSYLRLHSEPAVFAAFTPASQDGTGPEQRFFDIVHFIKERPHQYLDLIELAYYCLIAGFEGIQHGQANGRSVLDNLIEELYQLIQQHRVNQSHHLFKEQKKADFSSTSRKPLLTVCFLSLGLLIASYLVSYLLLENKAKTVQTGHHLIAKLDD
ncbi:DotU family type IV/VI secretion system protein [Legionella sp. MW5194]|uniref:type IVB secretion system protein IcmH/DotU n=1 Tax=Legionella sp. MW5194 TaxID=2662448 RepID=UPI00193EB6B6|nr:type IVB secretion system protein IcmH/DotU [Legionella sp. MW5194]QRN03159.1 DotU family type IV/VI secretion system protein [Legionella sp. MW5194]